MLLTLRGGSATAKDDVCKVRQRGKKRCADICRSTFAYPMFADRFLPILTFAYMTFADQTFADRDFCLSGLFPIAGKSIHTRQMPIDTNAYLTFAIQTFAYPDFCLSGLLPIGYRK